MTDFLFNREVKLVFTSRTDPTDVVTIEKPSVELSGKEAEPIYINGQVEKQLSTEPNRADVDIYNLSDSTAARINFRKPILTFEYGKKIDIFAGYEDRAKKIFSGVVISAITSREGKNKITRIACRNIFYELMQLPINKSVAKGELKRIVILEILKDIGATIEGRALSVLNTRLGGEIFKDATTLTGTAYNIINDINKGLLGVVTVYFDDIGTSFNPVGIPLDIPSVIYDASLGQIKGTPKPTEIGVDFTVPLDPDLKMSTPVILLSDTVNSFFGANILNVQSGRFVTKKILHAFGNRSKDDFESRVTTVFDRTNFTLTQTPVV